jgi:hypothetical protein
VVVAQEARVALGKVSPDTCVREPELADTLRRSGLVVSSSAPVRVDVSGTPSELVVVIHGTSTVAERLEGASCGTATDVVAAFVASALSPAPVIQVPDVPAASPAPQGSPTPEPVQGDAEYASGWKTRADSLALALEDVHEDPRKHNQNVLSSLLLLEGAITLLFTNVVFTDQNTAAKVMANSGGGLLLAGGIAGLLVPRDYQLGVVETGLLAGAGALFMASGLDPGSNDHVGDRSHSYDNYSLATASFATAGLVALRTALDRPPLDRLDQAYRELKGEAHVNAWSADRIRSIERDLARLEPAIPGWLVYSPLIAGGAVAAVGAAVSFARDGGSVLGWADLSAAVYLAAGIYGVLPGNPHRDYRRDLRRAGLPHVSFGPAPGGGFSVSLWGQF